MSGFTAIGRIRSQVVTRTETTEIGRAFDLDCSVPLAHLDEEEFGLAVRQPSLRT